MENLNSIWKFINARFTVESDVFTTTFLRETDAHSQAKNKYEKSLSKQKLNCPDNNLAPALFFRLCFFLLYCNEISTLTVNYVRIISHRYVCH